MHVVPRSVANWKQALHVFLTFAIDEMVFSEFTLLSCKQPLV